jgi:hypothetical protein
MNYQQIVTTHAARCFCYYFHVEANSAAAAESHRIAAHLLVLMTTNIKLDRNLIRPGGAAAVTLLHSWQKCPLKSLSALTQDNNHAFPGEEAKGLQNL